MNMKKILKWSAVLMLIAVVLWCSAAIAGSSGTDGNTTWTLSDDGVLTISGSGVMQDYGYTNDNGKIITAAPWGVSATSVVVEDGVTSISGGAFYGCSDLTSITIPDSVTIIGNNAFLDCSSLTSITIPDSVTSIGNHAFYNCSSLTGITIPDSVTSVGSYVFCSCSSLTSVKILCSVNNIGPKAFLGCSSLTSVTIPDSVTRIDNDAFSGCSSLTGITIPDSVTRIGERAFFNCSSLTGITIPGNVTSIGDTAFYGCSNLTGITIPDGVTRIGDSAFNGCSSLTSIAIPDGVTRIGDSAFNGCSSLTSIAIPGGVTSIGDYAFSGCSGLMSITIPDGVTSIGDYTFSGCSSLTGIAIPDIVTSIGKAAFSGCSGLMSITIPDGVTSIGDSAFSGCSSLMSIVIPDSVTSIGGVAFSGCSSLTGITIPDGVTSIGEATFSCCSRLMSVTIPDSVTSIGGWAFNGCDRLTGITIPDSVTSIGDSAFSVCSYLKTVIFLHMDENTSISLQDTIFDGSFPTIYCYMFTPVDSWAVNAFGQSKVKYLNEIDIESIRTVNLPGDFRMAIGDEKKLPLYTFPPHSSAVTGSSSDPGIISVQNGTVTALAAGAAAITATVGTVSDSVSIEVYIPATDFELSDGEVWMPVKSSLQLSVTSYAPAGAEADITWRSSDERKAAVDGTGLVTTIYPGDVTITAVTERGITRECLLHLYYPVTAVTLTAPHDRLLIGRDLQLTADVTMHTQSCVNHLVTFASSDPAVASVDLETGIVHGVSAGSVTITATSASNKSAAVELQVIDEADMWKPVFPASITVIEAEAFASTPFEAVIIPDTVTTIGSRAFADCKALMYVYIPAGVTSLAPDAFENCPNVIIDRAVD